MENNKGLEEQYEDNILNDLIKEYEGLLPMVVDSINQSIESNDYSEMARLTQLFIKQSERFVFQLKERIGFID